jgi:hypothetical protein
MPLAVAVTSHSLRLPSGSDVRVAQPFLNLCYVGVVIEGVGVPFPCSRRWNAPSSVDILDL